MGKNMRSILNFVRQYHLLVLIPSLISSGAYACGGEDLPNDIISSLPYVLAVQDKVAAVYGESVTVESIVRSGNNLLNLDKIAVASAMCSAKYINVYLIAQTSSELRCMTTFQLLTDGRLDFSGLKAGAECRRVNGAKSEWVDVPSNWK
jgi:hypothetical protein